MSSADALYEKLREIRYEATVIQAKLTDVFGILDSLHIVDSPKPKCPVCGIERSGPLSLAQHVYNSHDGPEPAHWLEAEGRSAEA